MTAQNNPLMDKSKAFAIQIVELSRYLSSEKKDFTLSRQILRSGTSIGANLAESEGEQSLADFISKQTIALKEAYETRYWLELLLEARMIHQPWHDQAQKMLSEIIAMLNASIMTAKRNLATSTAPIQNKTPPDQSNNAK